MGNRTPPWERIIKYIEAKLNDDVGGAIVFPAKTTHEENYLEFIAECKLRDELMLNDGDIVSLEFWKNSKVFYW